MTNGKILRARSWVVVPLFALSAACTTGVATAPEGTPTDPSAGSTGSGMPVAGGSGVPKPGDTNPGMAGSPGAVSTPGARDPGRVTVRRLNRVEYDNTVRDLLGTTQTPGQAKFINDAPQLGFDNNGDLQSLSPVQFSLYQQAAESLAAELLGNAAQRAKVITCDLKTGASCAQSVITSFALKAFRRPLSTDEVQRYLALMASAAQLGASPDEQFQTVLEALLVSPHFLFRPELDADPSSLTPHLLNPFETASRLSYAIYRSMPDDALFEAANAGKLSQPAEIQAQVERMLGSPKNAFSTTFPAQWLGTGGVPLQSFDATLFKAFTPALASSMVKEVSSFFSEFLTLNSPPSQLLTANFSYLDKGLADLYGVPAPAAGTTLTRSTFSTPQRGGLLTMAGILAVTSYPTRTSLVKRGAWVLSQLLCAPAPAPPDNVPAFPEGAITATSQREILAQHRANPACASCHDSIDNLGIALENYNAIGVYRTQDNGQPIDAAGQFAGRLLQPDGTPGPSFTGARELASTIAADPRFSACLAQNVMAYALGRAAQASDRVYLADITKAPSTGQLGLRDVVMNVVASDTFRMRRGDPTKGGM